jgi:hypothetical protein
LGVDRIFLIKKTGKSGLFFPYAMKIISLIIAVSFAFLIPFYSKAQLSVLRDNGTGNPILANPFKEVKGTQYAEDFKIGTLLLPNGQKVENLMIALNAYENTVEYKWEANLFAYTADKLAGFNYFSDSGELVEFTSEFVIPTLGKKRFLKIAEKGKYTLLVHQYKIMVDDINGAYGTQRAKVFQNQEEFFLVKDGVVFLLKNKKKDLGRIFGEDLNDFNAILKKQKLNLKNEADVRKLVRQLNQKI